MMNIMTEGLVISLLNDQWILRTLYVKNDNGQDTFINQKDFINLIKVLTGKNLSGAYDKNQNRLNPVDVNSCKFYKILNIIESLENMDLNKYCQHITLAIRIILIDKLYIICRKSNLYLIININPIVPKNISSEKTNNNNNDNYQCISDIYKEWFEDDEMDGWSDELSYGWLDYFSDEWSDSLFQYDHPSI